MASPKEIPELVSELVDMSKETIEPAKKLGRLAGWSMGAGLAFAIAALAGVLGVYVLASELLPEGAWWTVLSRFIAALAGVAGAGLVGWRMSR
jgi:hypothetical protein